MIEGTGSIAGAGTGGAKHEKYIRENNSKKIRKGTK